MKKFISTALILFLSVSFLFSQKIRFGMKTGINLASSVVLNEYTHSFPQLDKYGDLTQSDILVYSFDNSKNKYLLRPHLDFFMNFKISKKISLQPELSYSLQGYKIQLRKAEYSNSYAHFNIKKRRLKGEIEAKTSYLNIPLLLNFKASEKFSFLLGPQVGILLSGKKHLTSELQIAFSSGYNGEHVEYLSKKESSSVITSELKPIVLSICVGAEYHLSKKVFIEAKYILGLQNEYILKSFNNPVDEWKGSTDSKSRIIQTSIGYMF